MPAPGVLAPRPDTIEAITKDPKLMRGFDDPLVMKAVEDIASNPANIAQHMHNPAVRSLWLLQCINARQWIMGVLFG